MQAFVGKCCQMHYIEQRLVASISVQCTVYTVHCAVYVFRRFLLWPYEILVTNPLNDTFGYGLLSMISIHK